MSRTRLGPFAFTLALFLVGAAVFLLPFAKRQREVTASTPATTSLFSAPVPLPLQPGDKLCVTQVTLDPESELARFVVYTYNRPRGEPLDVSASGKGYSFEGRVGAGYSEGPVEVPVTPPKQSVSGQFCIGNAGDRQIALQASEVGQKFSRAVPYLNGQQLEQDIPLRFLRIEKQNLLGQLGRGIDHASVYVPLPEALIWVLLVLAAAGIALGVAWAVAAAATMAPAGVPDAAAGTPALPFARHGRRLRGPLSRAGTWAAALPAWLWVALVVVAAACFYFLWGTRTKTFQLDENLYVYLARWVDNSPDALFNFEFFGRGIQRLEVWLLAIPLAFMKGADALLAARAMNSLVYASAAVPAFLLVRGLGARKPASVMAAVLVVTGPWVIYATTFLTEPLAYPLMVWVMWAVWRAASRPTLGTETLAVVVIGLAALARTAFLLFALLLPLAVVLHELRFGKDFKRHRVTLALIAAGLLGMVASAVGILPPLSRLAGGYGTPFDIHWADLFRRAAFYGSRVTVGTGLLPVMIGLPWIVREVMRPRDERRHAFALVGALVIVLIVYASQTAGPDERYLMYYGAPLIIAAAVALDRRDLGPLWVAAGGAVAVLLVWQHGWNPGIGGYDLFVKPAEAFYSRTILLRLQGQVPDFMQVTTFVLLLQLGIAAIAAYAFTHGAARTVATLLAVGLVVLQMSQAGYAMQKYAEGPGERFGTPVTARDWIDDAIYGKSTAAIFATGQANSADYTAIWLEIQFWNTSLSQVFAPGIPRIQVPVGDTVGDWTEDETTGRITEKPRFPDYAVVARSFIDRELVSTVAAQAPYLAVDLVKVQRPLQLRYHVRSAPNDGLLSPETAPVVRVFRDGVPQAGSCLGVPFFAPLGSDAKPRSLSFELTGEGVRARRAVAAEKTEIVRVPLHFGDKPYVDFELASKDKVTINDGREVGGQLGHIFVAPCEG